MSQAKPSPNRPGQVGPQIMVGDSFGPAQESQSCEPAAQAVAQQYQINPSVTTYKQ